MDYQIVWSPEAIEDIESISSYISRDSEHYASAVVMKILDVGYEIQHTPFIGRIVPEFDDEVIRERIIYSYRLIYRIKEGTITVAAIIHGKQLLKTIDERIAE